MIANGAAQHGKTRLQFVEHRSDCRLAFDYHIDLATHLRERPQMGRQNHPNHASVCTSTDNTAGKSRTIGAQFSPPSGDAYTCPPEVPKYTPQESSESTA